MDQVHRAVEEEEVVVEEEVEEEWEVVSQRDPVETACARAAEQKYRTRGVCPAIRRHVPNAGQ